MHVIVIGAGVFGVCTAHQLALRGARVTVVDRLPGVARMCSFAPGGVLTGEPAAPLSAPGQPLRLLAGRATLRAGLPLWPSRWLWLARWARGCGAERNARLRAATRRLAGLSRAVLHELGDAGALGFEQSAGSLTVFEQAGALAAATRAAAGSASEAGAAVALDAAGCLAHEPALVHATTFPGGLYRPGDEAGNCAWFTRLVRERAAAAGVDFRFEWTVARLALDGNRVTGVAGPAGQLLAADAVVVAAGVGSGRLLRPVGVRLPLQPVVGCSGTAPLREDSVTAGEVPRIAVVDGATGVSLTPLGNRLRVAGLTALGSMEPAVKPATVAQLLRIARRWLPNAARWHQAQWWAGASTVLPDAAPLLGPAGPKGLLLNVGHGAAGWALACGSARVVADQVAGQAPAIDLDGLLAGADGRRLLA